MASNLMSMIVIVTYLHAVAATDDLKDEAMDKGTRSEQTALWFGPRLGKRSLRLLEEDQSQALLRLLEAADIAKYYYNEMPYEMKADMPRRKVAKKVILTPKLGRSLDYQERSIDKVEFVPRLGRKFSEKMSTTTEPEEYYEQDELVVKQVPSNYHSSQKFGRSFAFTPRLGRNLYDILSPQTRVTRSVNKTNTN